MWSSSTRFSFWLSKCIWIKYHWSLVRQVSHAVFAFSMWINTCNPSNKSTTFMSTFMCLCLQFKRGTAINWDKSKNCTCDLNGSVFSQQYVPGFHVPGGGEKKKKTQTVKTREPRRAALILPPVWSSTGRLELCPRGLQGVWALLYVTLTCWDFTEHNKATDSASSALL